MLSGAVAFDLVGGLLAFQMPPTRDAHAKSSLAARLGFAAVRVQAAVVSLTGQGAWRTFFGRYLAALGSTALLEWIMPAAAFRRSAALSIGAAFSVADVLASRGEQQRWIGPVILMKVIGGHAGIRRLPQPETRS